MLGYLIAGGVVAVIILYACLVVASDTDDKDGCD